MISVYQSLSFLGFLANFSMQKTPKWQSTCFFSEIPSLLIIPDSTEMLNIYIDTWNPKQPFINGCFNWMIPNLYIGNGCFTKHPFLNGCLGFQVEVYSKWMFVRLFPINFGDLKNFLHLRTNIPLFFHQLQVLDKRVGTVSSNTLTYSSFKASWDDDFPYSMETPRCLHF